jgi:DMSO/TMAO reductase YedYZ molybdopterin-dependent catalytic subunit
LPKVEYVTRFKCIEGWSTNVKYGGVRFSDFIHEFGPSAFNAEKFRYIGLETPDHEYYVSVDLPSMMHPQTLLCYEMNDQPLGTNHGAPLRLVIPIKYGIKSLKRVGTVFLSDYRPPDYWAERGYDWYAGL